MLFTIERACGDSPGSWRVSIPGQEIASKAADNAKGRNAIPTDVSAERLLA